MVASVMSFLIVGLQWGLIILFYIKQMPEAFNIVFIHFSPVMVFFALLDKLINFSGEFSYFLWMGLIFCVIKYFFLARSLIVDEDRGFFNITALFAEVAYLATSTWYIVTNSYI